MEKDDAILKEHVLNTIRELRDKKKRPDNSSICEHINKKFEGNYENEDLFTIILSLLDKNAIINKPTKQGLPSYFIVNDEKNNEEEDNNNEEEEEKERENSNDDFNINFELLGTPVVDESSIEDTNNSNVKNSQHNLPTNEIHETVFLKESIFNINAEIMAIKSFVMDELYSFNKTLDRVRTEQCDQTKLIQEMKNLSNENHTKTLIIKTLSENLNTVTKEKNTASYNHNKLNTDQYQNFQYPKKFVSISRKSNIANETEGISVSPNPFELLEHNNVQYKILDENNSNIQNTMMNPVINPNDNIQVVKRRPNVVINNHPENQNVFNRKPIVPGERTYSETIKNRNKSNTLIFSDSIPKGIKMFQFNKRLVNNNRAQLISFPGASSKRLLHYLDVHLDDKNTDTVILHIGVNDLLNDNSPECVNNLMENLTKMINKCQIYGVKNIFVSSIVYTVKVDLPLLESVHVKLTNFCQLNNISIIDNRNIRGECLYKDGLHLLEDGKRILGNNFISALNKLYDCNFLGNQSNQILTS